MAAAVYNVHHRYWHTVSGNTTEETIKRDIKDVAAARQHAMETARIAFAPKFDLSLVPSALIITYQLHKYRMHPFLRLCR